MIPNFVPELAWRGYVEMRKQKKKPLTEGAKVRAINTLERLHQEGEDLTLVLNQSEDNGWAGLFHVSESYAKQRGLSVAGKEKQGILEKLTDRSWAD